MSAFAGFMFLSDSAPTEAQAIGDLVVIDGTYTIEGITQPVDGNVTVGSGGELIIRDGTLSVISNGDAALRHVVVVEDGGTLTLEHGTLTVYLDQIDPWPFLDLTVQTGGHVVGTEGSVLMFPGTMTLTGGSDVSLYDSTITCLPEDQVTEFVVGGELGITADEANDGPVMNVIDSELMLFDSSIDSLPEYSDTAAGDLTLSGSASLLAVNSYLSVDFGPAQAVADWYVHNRLVLQDTSRAHLYGSTFEEYVGNLADRASAVEATGESFVAVPTDSITGVDTTGEPIGDIQVSNDGQSYHVAPGEVLGMDTFDVTIPGTEVDGATLYVRYAVDPGYDGTQPIMWNVESGSPATTGIAPVATETSYVERSFDLFGAGVTNTDDLATLDVIFEHDGSSSDVQFDSMSIVISIGPEAYIYRWLDVTVGDEYGVPIPGAEVSSVFTGSTTFGGQPSFYFGLDGSIDALPPAQVLDYMDKDTSDFGITEADGIVTIPFLTDLISGGQYPNSLFVGSFDITGSAMIDTTIYSSTAKFSFPAYPAMTDTDQSFAFTVAIADVVADSPDPSRWLVVTQGEVVIEDMTFYHSGDIIVAGTGTLIFRDAELLLIQSAANERTIYVDGDARLVFEDSTVTSELPINIVTLGNGALEVYDSVLEGVDIVALETSLVYLDGASTDGSITNAWDSYATLEVYNSELLVSPVLSGYATGSFTNTSLPSVIVQDDAVGYIYRWIHVTVFDGAGHTLPGALVTATGMFTGDYMNSSLTDDETGVALLNSLANIITAEDPDGTFVGLYTVNATYWYDGVPYESDYDVDISVLPYSTPLGSNATYATLTISSTLPDLAIDLVGGVVADPVSPKKGEETTITAFVRNDGVVGAYEVIVEFYHEVYGEVDMVGAVTVPVIGPGETAEVSVVWIAVEPLDYPHNMSVVIDPLNTVPEYDESPATSYVYVIVQKLADIMIEPTEITTGDVAVVDRLTSLEATIRNSGDEFAVNIWVGFYNGSISESNLIGSTFVDQLAPGGYSVASVDWIPTAAITHTIWVQANGTFDEITFDNNIASETISVLTPPDLALSDMYFDPASAEVEGGSTVQVLATLVNLQDAPFPYPTISVSIDEGTGPVEVDTISLTDVITASSNAIVVQWTYSVPMVDATTEVELYFEVNPDHSPEEQNYSNNIVHSTLTILDVREDFAVESAGLSIKVGGSTVTTAVFGVTASFDAEVSNLGARRAESFSVVYGILYSGENWTIASITPALDGGATMTFSIDWTVNITEPGAVTLWVALDVENAFVEQNESNNYAELDFTIGQMTLWFSISISDTEFKAGETMVVEGYVRYDGSGGAFVRSLTNISAELRDADGAAVAGTGLDSLDIESDDSGYYAFYFTIPTELEGGDYTVVMYHEDALGESESDPVLITGVVAGGGIPLIVWIIVILAIVAVVAGFTIYTYVYGLGKLVECGECGAFIPAASKRCPKCGVEFEANTMKCSECGAWVPADSAECPNCGVKFVGEELGEDEGDYLERMRKEYDEMVSKYRELAKAELGKKFSDKKFEEWWRQQPTFITFDDWLAKEEEKRKEGPVPCPVCGTLNPKEATVCHKCGTVFGERKEEPPSRGAPPIAPAARQAEQASAEEAPAETSQAQVAPAAAPRMVIRRPIDRKVVPKKIIKTPVGGTEEKTENGGDETQ